MFWLDVLKKIPMRMAKHWNTLSQEAVETLPMKILKTQASSAWEHAVAEGWLEISEHMGLSGLHAALSLLWIREFFKINTGFHN